MISFYFDLFSKVPQDFPKWSEEVDQKPNESELDNAISIYLSVLFVLSLAVTKVYRLDA